MTKADRIDIIKSVAYQYLAYKHTDTVYMREPSRETLIAQGTLIGVLMAFDLDFIEDKDIVIVKYRSGRHFLVVKL